MYGTSERTITFKRPIPVYITYQTAFVDDAGKAQSRADIYGLDKDVLAVLRGDRRVADVPVSRNYNSSSKPVMSNAAAGGGRRDRDFGYAASPGYTTWGSGGDGAQNFRSAYQPTDRNRVW